MEKSIKRLSVIGYRLSVLGALLCCGFSARADDASTLLSAPKLPPYNWFASTDPKHQNADYVLLKPNETRRVALGKGVLVRLWSTALEPEKIELSLQNGKRTELLKNGKSRLGNYYQKAFTWYPSASTPLAARDLKVGAALIVANRSAKENKWFYQATVRPIQKLSATVWKSVDSSLPGTLDHQDLAEAAGVLWRNWFVDKKTVKIPTRGSVAFWRAEGAGCISEIRIAAISPNVQMLRTIKLQLHADAKEIGSLSIDQIPSDGKEHVFEFFIPFNKGARLELVNEGNEPIQIKTQVIAHPLTSDYRLFVQSGSARSQKGKPIPILEVVGEGAFVGLVLDIRPAPDAHRRTFAFLEGNEILTADGRKYEGTGTEDFFNSAWYFPDKPFSQAYHGMTQKSTNPPSVTAYRWMIPDAVPFKNHFKFEFEHGNGSKSNDLEYRWVAFWYQKPDGQFEINDELKGTSTPASAARGTQSDSKEMLNFNPALLGVFLAALAGGVIVMFAVWLRRRKSKENA